MPLAVLLVLVTAIADAAEPAGVQVNYIPEKNAPGGPPCACGIRGCYT